MAKLLLSLILSLFAAVVAITISFQCPSTKLNSMFSVVMVVLRESMHAPSFAMKFQDTFKSVIEELNERDLAPVDEMLLADTLSAVMVLLSAKCFMPSSLMLL